MKQIEKLPELVFPKGTGIKDLSARLIKRDGRICMYERSDQVWEVFKVEIIKAITIKGILYPAHEMYPGNEDFGQNAWCFSNFENANNKYDFMVSTSTRLGLRPDSEVLQNEETMVNHT
jgi:hypothetical protein